MTFRALRDALLRSQRCLLALSKVPFRNATHIPLGDGITTLYKWMFRLRFKTLYVKKYKKHVFSDKTNKIFAQKLSFEQLY